MRQDTDLDILYFLSFVFKIKNYFINIFKIVLMRFIKFLLNQFFVFQDLKFEKYLIYIAFEFNLINLIKLDKLNVVLFSFIKRNILFFSHLEFWRIKNHDWLLKNLWKLSQTILKTKILISINTTNQKVSRVDFVIIRNDKCFHFRVGVFYYVFIEIYLLSIVLINLYIGNIIAWKFEVLSVLLYRNLACVVYAYYRDHTGTIHFYNYFMRVFRILEL